MGIMFDVEFFLIIYVMNLDLKNDRKPIITLFNGEASFYNEYNVQDNI